MSLSLERITTSGVAQSLTGPDICFSVYLVNLLILNLKMMSIDDVQQFRFNQYFLLNSFFYPSAKDKSRRKISTVPFAFDVNSEIS